MRVGQGRELGHLGPAHLALLLGKTEKKALFRREPLYVAAAMLVQIVLVGLPCNDKAAQVGDIFAERQFAVHPHARLDFVEVCLRLDKLCLALKAVAVSLCPPILEVAFVVKLRPLVVEAVRELMAYRVPNAGVV